MKKSFISKYKYELIFFTVFMFEFLLKIPGIDEMAIWRTTLYAVNYEEYGFVALGFIGSIYRLFTDYITSSMIYYPTLIATIVLIIIVSVFLGKMIKNSDEENKTLIMTLVMLYILSPISLTELFSSSNFGIYDVYLMAIAFLIALLSVKKKNFSVIFLLSVLALMIHHVFSLTYYMFVFGMLMYYVIESKFEKRTTAYSVVTLGICVIITMYFQFFTQEVKFATLDEAVEVSRANNGFLIEPEILSRYFDSTKEYIRKWSLSGLDGRTLDLFDRSKALLFTLTLLSPTVILFATVWIKSMKKSEDKMKKLFYLFCAASPLLSVVLFISAIDWDRWMMGILTAQISLLFFLLHKKDETICEVTGEISCVIKKHKFSLFAYCTLLGLLKFSPVLISLGNTGKELLLYGIKY